MDNIRLYIIIAVCSLIVIGVTILIAKFTKRNSMKYLPSVVFAVMALVLYIKSAYFSQSFQDIAFMLMAIMSMVLFVVSLVTAILLGRKK